MLLILIIVLIIAVIILSILKKKNVITLKFNGKKIIIILLIFLLLYGCLKIFVKRHNILNKTSDTSNNEKQSTFWLITLTTGWDYLCGHEEEWYFKIDYYTGEILEWSVTM